MKHIFDDSLPCHAAQGDLEELASSTWETSDLWLRLWGIDQHPCDDPCHDVLPCACQHDSRGNILTYVVTAFKITSGCFVSSLSFSCSRIPSKNFDTSAFEWS